jgi:hypothetical protein
MALNRFGSTLAEVEREHILETLTCCDGNRTRAAKFLDISLRCLRMKLHQFGQSGSRVAAGSNPATCKLSFEFVGGCGPGTCWSAACRRDPSPSDPSCSD